MSECFVEEEWEIVGQPPQSPHFFLSQPESDGSEQKTHHYVPLYRYRSSSSTHDELIEGDEGSETKAVPQEEPLLVQQAEQERLARYVDEISGARSEGYKEGYQTAQAEFATQFAQLQDRWEQTIADLLLQNATHRTSIEQLAVHNAVTLAERFLRQIFQRDPAILAEWLSNRLQTAADHKPMGLTVSPEQYDLLSQCLPSFFDRLREIGVTVDADATISLGCIVRCEVEDFAHDFALVAERVLQLLLAEKSSHA